MPAPYRLPVALDAYAGSHWLNTAAWNPTPGLVWFAPVFFFKLLASHAALGSPVAG